MPICADQYSLYIYYRGREEGREGGREGRKEGGGRDECEVQDVRGAMLP